MSKAEFEKFMRGKATAAMIALAATASAANSQARSPTRDRVIPAAEQTAEPQDSLRSNPDGKTLNLFGVAELGTLEENGQTFPTINGNVVFGEYQVLPKKLQKDYKNNQKEDFAAAPENIVDTVEVDKFFQTRAAASYDPEAKNIRFHHFATAKSDEELRQIIAEHSPQLSPEQLDSAVNRQSSVSAVLNDKQNPVFKGLIGHEYQHKLNDNLNTYAPGLSTEQYAKLVQYDEISANVAQLYVLEDVYKKQIAAGTTKEEALKIFDTPYNECFKFYRDALAQGIDTESNAAKQLKVRGTCKMWVEEYQTKYRSQLSEIGTKFLETNDVATLAMGNEKEFDRRVKSMFDNLDKNEELKKQGIKVGKLSEYPPEKTIPLEPQLRQELNEETLDYTGMTLEQGKQLSEAIPGSPKKDAATLIKILSGRKAPPKVKAAVRQTTVNSNDIISAKQYSK